MRTFSLLETPPHCLLIITITDFHKYLYATSPVLNKNGLILGTHYAGCNSFKLSDTEPTVRTGV